MTDESHTVSTVLEPLLRTKTSCKLLTCALYTDSSSQAEIQTEILHLVPKLWKTEGIQDCKVLRSEAHYFKLLLATLPTTNCDTETMLRANLNVWAIKYKIELQITSEILELVE